MTWNPYLGTQLGPAWAAIVDNLTDRQYGSDEICIAIAMRAGDIKRKTARNLVDSAINHGYLTAEIAQKQHGTFRRLRLTNAGRELKPPDQCNPEPVATFQNGDLISLIKRHTPGRCIGSCIGATDEIPTQSGKEQQP